jgi:SAM-dependent methyltransferase
VKNRARIWQFDYLVNRSMERAYAPLVKTALARCSNARVLDVGCGTGRWRALFPAPVDYVGLDMTKWEGVTVVASAEKIPLPDASFDIVFSNAVLEHVQDVAAAMSEMRRVLKPGGELILGTHGVWPIHGEPYDYRRWTPYGLEWESKAFASTRVTQIAGPLVNLLCIANFYLRNQQERNALFRFALAPFVLLNNCLGTLFPGRVETRATLAVVYVIHATK